PDGLNLLEQEKTGFRSRREFFVSETYGHLHRNVAKSLVTQRYKYTANKEDLAELYDLALDPYETRNLIFSEKHMPIVKELDQKLHGWVKEEGDIFYDGDREYILQKHFARGTSKPRD